MGWNQWRVVFKDNFSKHWDKCYKLVIIFSLVNLNQCSWNLYNYVVMYKKDARTKKIIGTQYGLQSLTKEYIMGKIFSKSKLLQYVISFLILIGLYRYVEKPLWIVQRPTTNKRNSDVAHWFCANHISKFNTVIYFETGYNIHSANWNLYMRKLHKFTWNRV